MRSRPCCWISIPLDSTKTSGLAPEKFGVVTEAWCFFDLNSREELLEGTATYVLHHLIFHRTTAYLIDKGKASCAAGFFLPCAQGLLVRNDVHFPHEARAEALDCLDI